VAGGAVHRKPYRASRALGDFIESRWLWIYGDSLLHHGTDIRDFDGHQLFALGAAYALRSVTETKEEREAKESFQNSMNELCLSDEEAQAEDLRRQEAATRPFGTGEGAVLTTTPSPGSVVEGVAGIREMPLG
jgi:hypothetical protein